MYRFSNDEPIIIQAGISYQLRMHKCTAEICSSTEVQGDIYIPKSIEHENQKYTITFIGSDSFKNNKNIKTVSIAEDSIIREIKDSAFKESSITKITIPSSVYTLGYKCFDRCENLESVEFFSKFTPLRHWLPLFCRNSNKYDQNSHKSYGY